MSNSITIPDFTEEKGIQCINDVIESLLSLSAETGEPFTLTSLRDAVQAEAQKRFPVTETEKGGENWAYCLFYQFSRQAEKTLDLEPIFTRHKTYFGNRGWLEAWGEKPEPENPTNADYLRLLKMNGIVAEHLILEIQEHEGIGCNYQKSSWKYMCYPGLVSDSDNENPLVEVLEISETRKEEK